MSRHLLLLAAVAGLPLFAITPATAQTYPWCATAQDSVSCLHTSYEQCMTTVRGQGGLCTQNPFFPDQAKRSAFAKSRKQ